MGPQPFRLGILPIEGVPIVMLLVAVVCVQSDADQLTKQSWLMVCQELESATFIRLHARRVQDDRGQFGDLRLSRSSQFFQTPNILLRNVRLLPKTPDLLGRRFD